YQQKVTEAFFSALPVLLKGDPVLTLAPLSWKNAKGETTLNLSHYVPAHEGPEDALVKDFPLQLITWKGKNRANSTQYANPWL
ncbi:DUF945 family protein, partial [Salmonella enterica subsp. enterica serovar Lubbock]|nr:DUF945 family protein [Salmonella enterica subsp. enterica serovar Lubbock]